MKYIHTHFKLFLLFGVLAVFFGCEKDEPYDPSKEMDDYFEGKVNGVEFETSSDWPCHSVQGNVYLEDYLTFEGGYFVAAFKNCETSEKIVLGTESNLHEGIFTSCDSSDHVRPRGEFYNTYASTNSGQINANECLEIELKISRIVEFSSNDGYIEGQLNATVRDPEADSTIIISDVKFGYKY